MYEEIEGGEDCEACQNTDNTLLYNWEDVETWLCPSCADNYEAERIDA